MAAMDQLLLVAGCALATLAGAIHIYIFVLETVLWRRPATWRVFGLRSQADADTTSDLAFNQGFYNLFLAAGAFVGVAIVGVIEPAGVALVLASMASMLLASVVLISTSKRMLRAAAIQGALPLVAIALVLSALATRS
ncbi:MAG: DUF1304 domain-containing protein [Burkholderiaceae bacterium]|nr:DUF1304 domain-containing protein [Microbacteriaceae bacterium]